jgi:hypothetical protein
LKEAVTADTKLTISNEAFDRSGEYGLVDLLPSSGFPEDVDFHPHGMALTPDWVNKDEKKLFVINHAWINGGERIEVFKINKDA